MKYVDPGPVKFHIELNLRSGRREQIRVCDPHHPDIPLNSVEAQLGAMDMADFIKGPQGKVITGVTTGGSFVMVPDYEIEYMRVTESPHKWNDCQLDNEVFAPDDRGEDAEIINIRPREDD